MAKNTKLEVRLHAQEREWLLSLGNGNIIEGVRNLVEQAKEKRTLKDDYYLRGKRRKSRLWGHKW